MSDVSYRERMRAVIRQQRGRIIELQKWLNQADELARRNWALFCNANRKPATNYYNQEQKQMTDIEAMQSLYNFAQEVIKTQRIVIQLRDEQIANLRGKCDMHEEHIKVLQARLAARPLPETSS